MGMILRIASSRIVGQGDIVGRSGYFSLNLSANSVMRGRLDARRTLKSLVADLRYNSSSARIIDEYKLTSNNCTTMVSDVLNKSGSNALKETRLQQTSNFGTWTTIPIVNRFILPISMQNHLVRISKPGGVVYKTR